MPYIAWRMARDPGSDTLMRNDCFLRSGGEPASSLNTLHVSFLVKGEDEHDHVAVLRDPLCTRPPSMTHCDNEAIVAANRMALAPDFRKTTHTAQNGFILGRNFLNYLVDVDSACRIYSMLFEHLKSINPEYIPIAGAFDFEAAFPSVIHDWIWLVVRNRKMLPD